MCRICISFAMACFLILVLHTSPVFAKSITIERKGSAISTYPETSLGKVYVIDFDVPGDVVGKRLDTVLLEFYVDASLKEGVEIAHSPVIELYPLSQAFAGEGTPMFDKTYAAAVRNLNVGAGKRVLVDITDIVKSWIAGPSTKHGLILGSLTGLKNGRFSLRSDILGGEVAAKIKFYYQNRFGGKVPH